MRHYKNTNKFKQMGLESQKVQENNRLSKALNYRPTNSYLVFKISTYNPRNSAEHLLEIKHEMNNGNNRYNVYLDGVKWHKPWSRWGFCKWLFDKIDPVILCE